MYGPGALGKRAQSDHPGYLQGPGPETGLGTKFEEMVMLFSGTSTFPIQSYSP